MGDLLDDQAEQHGVGVGVVELRARGEPVGVLEGDVEQLARRPLAMRLGRQQVLEARVLAVGEQAAAHVRELTQRDVLSVGHSVDVRGDRVVQADLAAVDELEQRGDGEGLGLAADPHVQVGAHRGAVTRVRDAESPHVARLSGLPDAHDHAGDTGIGGRLLDHPVQFRRGRFPGL